jgi:PadR family transcriptional regulator, regulatory protein PadR
MDLFPGTLELMILELLRRGPLHGYGIAKLIKLRSQDALRIEEGSLYPALQRLLRARLVTAHWKLTETKRRARYYSLTAAGRRRLGEELTNFEGMVAAIARVLKPAGGEQ